jgi:hypothetical protein
MSGYDVWDSVECNDYWDDGEGKEACELEFALQPHCFRHDDDRNWEEDEEEVGNDIRDSHSDELSVALPALRWSIFGDEPVVGDWNAFCEVCDEDGEKGEGKEVADELKGSFVAGLPEMERSKSFEKFGDGKL